MCDVETTCLPERKEATTNKEPANVVTRFVARKLPLALNNLHLTRCEGFPAQGRWEVARAHGGLVQSQVGCQEMCRRLDWLGFRCRFATDSLGMILDNTRRSNANTMAPGRYAQIHQFPRQHRPSQVIPTKCRGLSWPITKRVSLIRRLTSTKGPSQGWHKFQPEPLNMAPLAGIGNTHTCLTILRRQTLGANIPPSHTDLLCRCGGVPSGCSCR